MVLVHVFSGNYRQWEVLSAFAFYTWEAKAQGNIGPPDNSGWNSEPGLNLPLILPPIYAQCVSCEQPASAFWVTTPVALLQGNQPPSLSPAAQWPSLLQAHTRCTGRKPVSSSLFTPIAATKCGRESHWLPVTGTVMVCLTLHHGSATVPPLPVTANSLATRTCLPSFSFFFKNNTDFGLMIPPTL